jgi:hypothetical protein
MRTKEGMKIKIVQIATSIAQRLSIVLHGIVLLLIVIGSLLPPAPKASAYHQRDPSDQWSNSFFVENDTKNEQFRFHWKPRPGNPDDYFYYHALCHGPGGANCKNSSDISGDIDLGSFYNKDADNNGGYLPNKNGGWTEWFKWGSFANGPGTYGWQLRVDTQAICSATNPCREKSLYSNKANVEVATTGVCGTVNSKLNPPQNVTAELIGTNQVKIKWSPPKDCAKATHDIAMVRFDQCSGGTAPFGNNICSKWVVEALKAGITEYTTSKPGFQFNHRYCVIAHHPDNPQITSNYEAACASEIFKDDTSGNKDGTSGNKKIVGNVDPTGGQEQYNDDDCGCPEGFLQKINDPIGYALCRIACAILSVIAAFYNLALQFLQRASGF